MRDEIAAGNPSWIEHWRGTDADERVRRDDAWLEEQRAYLIAAVVG
jgi:hypothetical protein